MKRNEKRVEAEQKNAREIEEQLNQLKAKYLQAEEKITAKQKEADENAAEFKKELVQ